MNQRQYEAVVYHREALADVKRLKRELEHAETKLLAGESGLRREIALDEASWLSTP